MTGAKIAGNEILLESTCGRPALPGKTSPA